MEYTFYAIICKDENITDCYVGSTKNYKHRQRNHKTNCNNPKSKNFNCKVYQFIRENGGFDKFEFIELETKICETKREALIREQHWMETLKANLNTKVPGRTHEEYYEDTIEKHLQYQKEYREVNREQINQQFTCECGGKYVKRNKATHFKTKKHQDYINLLN